MEDSTQCKKEMHWFICDMSLHGQSSVFKKKKDIIAVLVPLF